METFPPTTITLFAFNLFISSKTFLPISFLLVKSIGADFDVANDDAAKASAELVPLARTTVSADLKLSLLIFMAVSYLSSPANLFTTSLLSFP